MTEIVQENERKGGKTAMTAQQDLLTGVKEAALFITALVGAWLAFIRLPKWIIHKLKLRREKKEYIVTMLKKLCNGQNDLCDKMAEMDNARNKARVDDADVRASLYLGQIAMIGAIRELARHMGIEINGEVKKYYDLNVDCLRKGVGMAPIHATPIPADKKDQPYIAMQDIAEDKKEG